MSVWSAFCVLIVLAWSAYTLLIDFLHLLHLLDHPSVCCTLIWSSLCVLDLLVQLFCVLDLLIQLFCVLDLLV